MEKMNFYVGQLRPTTNGSLYFQNEEMFNTLSNLEPKEIWDNGTKVWGSGLTQTDKSFFISAVYNKTAENILRLISEGEKLNDFELSFTYAKEGEEYVNDDVVENYKTTGVHLLKLESSTLNEKLDIVRAKEALIKLKSFKVEEKEEKIEEEREEERAQRAIEELLSL